MSILFKYFLLYFYNMVLKLRIELRILSYQDSGIPFTYKSKTGCCSIAGNRTPISTTVPNCTASQILAGISVC